MSPKSKELIDKSAGIISGLKFGICSYGKNDAVRFIRELCTRIEQLESAIDEFAEAQGRLEKIIADLESQVK